MPCSRSASRASRVICGSRVASANHNLRYRPLCGGIAVYNPRVDELGTLGVVWAGVGAQWVLSCYHVLCARHGGTPVDGDPVFQPIDDTPQSVARVNAMRSDAGLDCAAARLTPGIQAVESEILGIGELAAPRPPVVGIRVMKSGAETGVTEGLISAVVGDRITIDVPPSFPGDYELTRGGDSGALWVTRDGRAPVALHVAGNDTGKERAFGISFLAVLATLGLNAH